MRTGVRLWVNCAPRPPSPPSQAKDLVESAPCVILTKVKAEDSAKIVEKLKAATGGEYELV